MPQIIRYIVVVLKVLNLLMLSVLLYNKRFEMMTDVCPKAIVVHSTSPTRRSSREK